MPGISEKKLIKNIEARASLLKETDDEGKRELTHKERYILEGTPEGKAYNLLEKNPYITSVMIEMRRTAGKAIKNLIDAGIIETRGRTAIKFHPENLEKLWEKTEGAKILELLKTGEPLSAKQISKALGVTEYRAYLEISKMQKAGLLVAEEKVFVNAKAKVFSLAKDIERKEKTMTMADFCIEEKKPKETEKKIDEYVLNMTAEGNLFRWIESNKIFDSERARKETGLNGSQITKAMMKLREKGLIEIDIGGEGILIKEKHPEKLKEFFENTAEGKMFVLIKEKPCLTELQILQIIDLRLPIIKQKLDKLVEGGLIEERKAPFLPGEVVPGRRENIYITSDFVEKIIAGELAKRREEMARRIREFNKSKETIENL